MNNDGTFESINYELPTNYTKIDLYNKLRDLINKITSLIKIIKYNNL